MPRNLTGGLSLFFGGLGPAFLLLAVSIAAGPPTHLIRTLQHVVAVPTGNGTENHLLRIVTDLLDVILNFFANFQKPGPG